MSNTVSFEKVCPTSYRVILKGVNGEYTWGSLRANTLGVWYYCPTGICTMEELDAIVQKLKELNLSGEKR